MKTQTRRLCWLMVSVGVAAAVAAASVGAVTNWASEEALGDVAVSFDSQILLLDNANPDPANPVDTLSETGVTGYGGLVFDAFLNLVATKTDPSGAGQLARFGPLHPHSRLTPNLATQPSPSALAIAADGTIYVASRSLTSGTRAIISRIPPTGASQQFNIIADTTTCIGIDLDPNQTTLWVVTGGRTVKNVLNANTAIGDTAAATFLTFGDNGAACGIRLLAPPDIRDTPTPPPDLVRFVVADGKEVKFVRSQPNSLTPQIAHFDAGNGTKKWFDVAIDPDLTDPNIADVWAVDRGGDNLAKFRLGTGATVFVRDLGLEPKGLAVNGELRAAQTVVVPVTLNPQTTTEAIFYAPNTATRFSWLGKSTTGTPTFAIQAFEVTSDAATSGTPNINGICAPSLNIHCRLVNNFSNSVPKIMSRGRGAVIREIWRVAPADNEVLTLGIAYRDLTSVSGGSACVPNQVPPATAWLRDPYPHDQFSLNLGLAVYGGDDTVYTRTCRTCSNDNLVVDQTSPGVKYNLRIINPAPNVTVQIKKSLPISVEVTDPMANCAAVPGLNGFLMLTVTDVTTHPGTPLGDSEGIVGTPLTSTGHPFAFSANLYRTNLKFDPAVFSAGRVYRICPQIPAATKDNTLDGSAQQQFEAPLANEACRDVSTIK